MKTPFSEYQEELTLIADVYGLKLNRLNEYHQVLGIFFGMTLEIALMLGECNISLE